MAALAVLFLLLVVSFCVLVLLLVVLRILLPLVVLIFFAIACLAAVALYPASIIWAYMDAEARGKPGWALALLVAASPLFFFIGWPLGLLAWVVFRPAKTVTLPNLGPGTFASTPGHA